MSDDYELGCPGCEITMNLDEETVLELQGGDVECPECGTVFELPVIIEIAEEAEEVAAAPPPPPQKRKQIRTGGSRTRTAASRRSGSRSRSSSGSSRKGSRKRDSSGASGTSGVAIASLVTALLGIPLAAIICGHIARSQIKKSDGALTGGGMALAGLIMGYLAIAFCLLAVPIMLPAFMAARESAQSAACLNNMRVIDKAADKWAMESNIPNGTPVDANAVNQSLGNMPTCPLTGKSYQYGVVFEEPSCSSHGSLSSLTQARAAR